MPGMTDLTLDHVIIGVSDLPVARRDLTAVLGRSPSWRGRHPTYGTANVLYRLDNAYVELLAPDPNATTDSAWTGSLGRFLKEKGDGLFSVALATKDAGATTASARSRGLLVESPAEGEGVDLDTGAMRRWSNARVPPGSTRGTRAFFIEHRSPPDALPMAPLIVDRVAAVDAVQAVIAESSEIDGARRMWREVFGLPEVEEGHMWRYDLGNASLVLRPGASSGAATDRWSRLVLHVPSVEAMAKRLAAAGTRAERGDIADAQALLVTSCGASLFLTEAS